MQAIENVANKITITPRENSPIQTEALDLLMTNSKGQGCARPSEPDMLDFTAIGNGVAKGLGNVDHVDGKKVDTDTLSVHHHKDHGCALPSNPEVLDFDAIGNGGGAKGPGRIDNDKKVDGNNGNNVDTDTDTVRHYNPHAPFDYIKTPVHKQPPHVLDGVCFTPNFDKLGKLPAPAWAPVSQPARPQPQPAPHAEKPKTQPGVPRLEF